MIGPVAGSPDLATLALWLADARTAYHRLMTGGQAIEIAVDGATFVTKFARPDADKLAAYITGLEARIRSGGVSRRGPGAIGILFT